MLIIYANINLSKYQSMKRILGLDLGASSIGWAIVDEYNNEIISNTDTVQQDKIVALGSRIIPLTTDESTQYKRSGTDKKCR